MSIKNAKEYINNSIQILNSMNWLISTQKTEAIIYLDKALKELKDQNMEKIYKGEIQRLLPIFQAMADGRIIQFAANGNDWTDIDGEEESLFLNTLIDNPQYYRIKPKEKYRPFKNAEVSAKGAE